jgi:hypothetical protein
MDPRIEKLKAAGFSDEDIKEYLASSPPATAAGESVVAEPPSVSMEVPATAPGAVAPDMSAAEVAGTVGAAVAPYAVPAALTAGGIYGGSVIKKGFDAMKESAAARTAQANAQMKMAEGIQQRFDAKQAAQMNRPGAAPTYNVPTGTPRPGSMPVPTSAPAAAPAPVAPQIQNAQSIVQRLALNKILPAVSNFANKALPAAQVGMGLFYTSPEEIAILKAAEEKKRAQGRK